MNSLAKWTIRSMPNGGNRAAHQNLLAGLADPGASIPHRILLVAAHPDDDVIGIGGQFPRLRDFSVLHVTDGAPRNMRDAVVHGYTRREDYAAARAAESCRAGEIAGACPRHQCLGFADQEASLQLGEIALVLARRIDALAPDAIITHAYEGGHPDHDAAAFATRAALNLLERSGVAGPALIEMTAYNGRGGVQATGCFLPNGPKAELTMRLPPRAQAIKRAMLDCFVTQRRVLAPFGTEIERFRTAPRYDFTLAPHDGTLWYERFNWGMSGARWRRLARAALASLERLRP